jgi:hypothetical protein
MDHTTLACCSLAFVLYYNTLDAGFVYDDRLEYYQNFQPFITKFFNCSVVFKKKKINNILTWNNNNIKKNVLYFLIYKKIFEIF